MGDYYKRVVREERLVMWCYYFALVGRAITLNSVCKYSRPSRKYRWRAEGEWRRHPVRCPLPAIDKPDVPADVIAEVRKDLAEIPIEI